ncbi:MAG: hypothetical protein HY881_09075 [Deltaproteobacteria bacterium]|nr:hypothetical protein [Deltaproteobacteria bacterium]
MHLIDLDKAKPGMTLAKPVHTLQDVLLLKPDVRLTEKNIHILKSWGIREIWIEDAAGESVTGHMDPEHEIRAFIDDELRAKFSETLPDPLMEEILRIAGNLLEKRLLKKENKHGAQKP